MSVPQAAHPGSLTGITVVEIGTSVAAPFAAQVLGDLGAEVIKVERIGTGDDSRSWAPPDWDGTSITFLGLNRNKKSIALDYKDPRGKAVLRSLLASADVLIQNLRPGSLAAAGFSAEKLKELNPRLVYCELTGFGPEGPRAGKPAYDPLVQAYSGIVSMTGEEDAAPSRVPVSLLDMGTGMWAVIGIFEALRRRDITGDGTHLELSLLQTALTWLTMPLMSVAAGNGVPTRLGSGLAGVVPYGAFPTEDGHVFISAGNNDLWSRLCDALDDPALGTDPRFTANEERVRRRSEVTDELSVRTSHFSSLDLLSRLESARVPCSPVQTLDEVVADPQVAALGTFSPVRHSHIDDLQVVNLPMSFDRTRPGHVAAPPELGADTVALLRKWGVAHDEIAGMLADGVIEDHLHKTRPGDADE